MKVSISKGFLYALGFFLIFGVITRVIPNNYFIRMTPVNYLDWFFLTTTAVLLGVYFAIPHKENKKCKTSALSGGIFGFLGFGCALCNKILLLILGVAGVLSYVEPYRPLLGSLGIIFLFTAVVMKIKE